jgi:hypothetical protein
VFLLGGRTKDIPPVPILVRSGDVVVMSGESRYCYHGVPHILSPEEEDMMFPTPSSCSSNSSNNGNSSSNSSNSSSSFITSTSIAQDGPAEIGEREEKLLETICATSAPSSELSSKSGSPPDEAELKVLENVKLYLTLGRININVRQVAPTGGGVWEAKCGSGATMQY